MRASFAIAALSASGAIATTSVYVQPITQISDGQIQAPTLPAGSSSGYIPAPPATTGVVVVPSSGVPEIPGTTVIGVPTLPETVTVVVPTLPESVTVVVPTLPPGNSTVPVVPSYANSTVATATTGAPAPTSGSPGGSPTVSSPPQDTGAANVNMVNMASFGGLVLAVAGLLA